LNKVQGNIYIYRSELDYKVTNSGQLKVVIFAMGILETFTLKDSIFHTVNEEWYYLV